MTALPEVSRTMSSAWRTGTPLCISVPSVRVVRPIEDLRMSSPNPGSFSLIRSKNMLPHFVLLTIRQTKTSSTTPIAIGTA